VSRVDIGGMNIFSLLFLDVTLILEFLTLLILRAFFARNACGSGAFANFVANLFGKCAFYPVFFPVTKDLASETGSYLTAHTTTQSPQTTRFQHDVK
jgi:hypothetical protein